MSQNAKAGKLTVTKLNSDLKQQALQNKELKSENEVLKLKVLQLEGLTLRLSQKLDRVEEQIEDLQCRGMQKNLLIYNIEEKKDEDAKNVVKDFLLKILKLSPTEIAIDTVHRMGKPNANKKRPIVVQFQTQTSMQKVKSCARRLKGTAYRISDQLPKEVRLKRAAMVPHMKDLREAHPNSKTYLRRDQLFHAGQRVDSNFESNAVKLAPTKSLPMAFDNLNHTEVKLQNKSKFQGHACRVTNLTEVGAALAALHQDGYSSTATHIIYAYRITENQLMTIKGHSDDGEWTAGGLLANSLQQKGKTNIFVAVTRHYGGQDIGPQRFTIIQDLGEEAADSLDDADDNDNSAEDQTDDEDIDEVENGTEEEDLLQTEIKTV